MLAVFFPVKVC